MPPSGKGKRKILIVGEAPGRNEDERGIQFCGKSGQSLLSALAAAGIAARRDCWITNALICRPPSNATPTDAQIEYCRPNLAKTIRDLKPEIIVPLGGRAVKSVLSGLWREDVGQVERWAGRQIPDRTLNAWICPTWHPAFLLRQNDRALDLWWERHLRAIARLECRPYGSDVEDLTRNIELITKPSEAARRIRGIMLLGDHPAAFDYETTCLKPELEGAEIVCCSICWEGRTTIAFPWAGEAIDATREFLRSKAPKVGANIKFEQRWTMEKLGCRVRNWDWDCMQSAHVLDSRAGTTSVKFQQYVRLGMQEYDSGLRPYLKENKRGLNRIKQVSLRELLRYCAIDSLVEYLISDLQKQEMKGVSNVGSDTQDRRDHHNRRRH